MQTTSIGDALFTKTQQKVLGLLYGRPDSSFYLNEIVRIAGVGKGTIKRELERMESAGLLTVSRIGNQNHFQSNSECPVYSELLGIVRKTFGISDVIKAALMPLISQIAWSFIFGSVASGKETSGSDIDLLIIGDVSFSDVVGALYPAQTSLGREINPKIYNKKEWNQMLKSKDAFVKAVLTKPKLMVVGYADELG